MTPVNSPVLAGGSVGGSVPGGSLAGGSVPGGSVWGASVWGASVGVSVAGGAVGVAVAGVPVGAALGVAVDVVQAVNSRTLRMPAMDFHRCAIALLHSWHGGRRPRMRAPTRIHVTPPVRDTSLTIDPDPV